MDELPIQSGDDVVRVRQQVRVVAAGSGLSLVDQTKLVTAASELARNALVHGGGGTARVEVVTSATGRTGVRVGFSDDGPGIADVDLALTDGWTIRQRAGAGPVRRAPAGRRVRADLQAGRRHQRRRWSSGHAELAAPGPGAAGHALAAGGRRSARWRPAGSAAVALAAGSGSRRLAPTSWPWP